MLLALALAPPPVELAEGPWEPVAADGVAVELGKTPSCPLLLHFDFRGVAGWVGARRMLPTPPPESFQLALRLAGEVPQNRLELKLVAGENVFWHTVKGFSLPGEPRELTVGKRKFRYAWGPRPDAKISEAQALELVFAAETGGKGELCLQALTLTSLPAAVAATPGLPPPGAAPNALQPTMDGDLASFWQARNQDEAVLWELGEEKELFGLAFAWGPQRPLKVQLAARCQQRGRTLAAGPAPPGPVAVWSFPSTCAEAVRAELESLPGTSATVAEVLFALDEEGSDPSWAYRALARLTPPGRFPRGMRGEQVYWTITGWPEGATVLVSELGRP